jgi:hypothetical protein
VTTLVMVVEAIGFAALLLAFLVALGLGVTELLASSAGGFQLLLAPAVGLAILELGFEWLTGALTPALVALVLVVPFGALTAVMVWRRHSALLSQWRDLAVAGVATLTFYLALLVMVFARGFFTLAGWSSDNVFIYIPSAQYLLDHRMPVPLHAPALQNPGSWYLAFTGIAFPGTTGSIDAAVSDIIHWPLHALFDPLNALTLALTVATLWFFVRVALAASFRTAVAAALLLMTNQFIYWTFGSGFHQEAQALPIFVAGLGLTAHALKSGSVRSGALAGIMAGSLPGLYFPLAVLFAICAAGCVIATVVAKPKDLPRALLRPLAAAVVAGVAASAFALYSLVSANGLSLWLSATNARSGTGGVSSFPRPQYLAGTVPFSHVWEALPQALTRLETLFLPALIALAVIVYVLGGLGLIRATRSGHGPEAAIIVAGLLFALYEALIPHYAYGFTKVVCYMAPFTSAFIAYGAVDLGSWVKGIPRLSARTKAANWLGIAALVVILPAFANSSRDMVRMWLVSPPTFTRADLGLAAFAEIIPTGASVLVDDPTDQYRELVKIGAVGYALPDRNVRVYSGTSRIGTFVQQDVLPTPCRFDFVIGPKPPDGPYILLKSDAEENLNVYQWAALSCP